MDLVTIPQALLAFYGAVVLSCGAGLGIILGRNFGAKRQLPKPDGPDQLARRVQLLETELDEVRGVLEQPRAEHEFLRQLPPDRQGSIHKIKKVG
jgi:hypothetical protein